MPQNVIIIPGRLPESRVDRLTNEHIIISSARSQRDGIKIHEPAYPPDLPEWKENCAFCPGNEDKTPEELVAFSHQHDPKTTYWINRGFTNMYPILALESSGGALGVNEVVVETRRHNGFLSSLSDMELSAAFKSLTARYFSLKGDPRLEWFSVSKNYGKMAGASMEHPHLQIAVMAQVPEKFEVRFLRARKYFRRKNRYICCDNIKYHQKKKLKVFETKHFILFVPWAAIRPYHMRLYPKKHNPSFAHVLRDNDEIRKDFAYALRSMILIYKVAVLGENGGNTPDPLYNFFIDTAPFREDHKEGIHHWYLEFEGKTSIDAGFEMHTGIKVNPTYPEEIAEKLRTIAVNYMKK